MHAKDKRAHAYSAVEKDAYQFVQGFLAEDRGKQEEAEHEKDG
jgi:hypothetical protein